MARILHLCLQVPTLPPSWIFFGVIKAKLSHLFSRLHPRKQNAITLTLETVIEEKKNVSDTQKKKKRIISNSSSLLIALCCWSKRYTILLSLYLYNNIEQTYIYFLHLRFAGEKVLPDVGNWVTEVLSVPQLLWFVNLVAKSQAGFPVLVSYELCEPEALRRQMKWGKGEVEMYITI